MYLYRQTLKLPKDKQLLLVPLGDVQGEEQLHRLDNLIAWCVAKKKEGHLIGLILTGDYFETYSPSERVKLAGANFHETTLETIYSNVKAQADDFIRRLAPLKGSVFIVLQGHHWQDFKVNGLTTSSDRHIANELGAEYAGDGIAVLDLLITGIPFRIMAMHGYGTGRLPGGRVNKRLQMRDCLLYTSPSPRDS